MLKPKDEATRVRDKLQDLSLIIDLNHQPVLVRDAETRELLLANTAFYNLTGYSTLEELEENAISAGMSSADSDSIDGVLHTRLMGEVNVNILEKKLPDAGVIVYQLDPVETNPHQPATLFIDFNLPVKFDTFAAKMLSRLRSALNADYAALYAQRENAVMLDKMLDDELEPLFPDEVSISELLCYQTARRWDYLQPVETEFEQVARDGDLFSLMVVPMGSETKQFGLLAIGSSLKVYQQKDQILLHQAAEALARQYDAERNRDFIDTQVQRLSEELSVRNFQIEAVTQGMVLVSSDLKVIEINSAAELMLGYSEDEVTGQAVESVLIGAEGLLAALRSAASGVPIHDIGHVSIHRRDGQVMPARVQVLPIVHGNAIALYLIVIDDISEVQQNQMRAQHLEQRAVIGELSAVFAHEVRNPVNNISTGLQLLEMKLGKDDPNQDNISRMQADCQRINHLMESVLAFSRPIEASKQEIDLPFMLQRILDRWHPRMMKVNVEPFFQTESGLPPIKGDQRALERVFINLVGNAVEAMKEKGGVLSVKINLTNEIAGMPHVQVAVSDTGPGIPDAIVEDIFKPFVTTTTNGTGLGLAISNRIVSTHKGTMKFKTFPGGTIFSVFLPVKAGEE